MADYREISQEYAQGAIKACILINAGAAAALLTQAAKFIEIKNAALTSAITCSMLLWAFGTVAAISTWVLAFLSTRYVDKSEKEVARQSRHLRTSDIFMLAGVIAVVGSLALFVAGCITLAVSLRGST
ncbi:hypothetical protein [Bradyrhizobium cenepequi]|uniref:hypothetical protein n=1 Tax=Bradyrhizobium cenepequi TaxID=2821403 RepID=UPI001CE2683C|nr:hypothetical protein [Bradyrhizobium cenepequi]MCA6109616.1 hypothetical protein [Bradyrhizobium cenepequi]